MDHGSSVIEAVINTPEITVDLVRHSFREEQKMSFLRQRYMISKPLSSRVFRNKICVKTGRNQQVFTGMSTALLPPDLPVFVSPQVGSYRCVRCTISQDLFLSITGFDEKWYLNSLHDCFRIHDNAIDDIMFRLSQELANPGYGSEKLIRSTCESLLIYISRSVKESFKPVGEVAQGLAKWQLEKINDYLENLIGQPPLLENIAGLLGISAGHLSRTFKKATGFTVHDHIERIRMRRAQKMLMEGALSQKEIAWILGFSSPSSFSVAFRKILGETPNQFRLRFRPGHLAARA